MGLENINQIRTARNRDGWCRDRNRSTAHCTRSGGSRNIAGARKRRSRVIHPQSDSGSHTLNWHLSLIRLDRVERLVATDPLDLLI